MLARGSLHPFACWQFIAFWHIKNAKEAVEYLLRLQELNGGSVELVVTPSILLAGDTYPAACCFRGPHSCGSSRGHVPSR